jgi:hypothetical protein
MAGRFFAAAGNGRFYTALSVSAVIDVSTTSLVANKTGSDHVRSTGEQC